MSGLNFRQSGDHRGGRCGTRDHRRHGRYRDSRSGESTFIPLAENHLSGGRLQNGSDRDVDRLANHLPRVVDHYHGAVVQIRHALVVFLAFFEDEHLHDLARQDDGFEGVRQFVDIQHFDALQLRDLVQIKVVGDDLAFIDFSQFDQLQVDFADGGEIVFHDLDLQRGHFLQALKNVETAAAAVPFQGVGRISHKLQFAQHKLRCDYDTVEKSGFGDVGDAAIDDYTGVQNFVAFAALLLAAKDSAESRQIQQVALARAYDQPT